MLANNQDISGENARHIAAEKAGRSRKVDISCHFIKESVAGIFGLSVPSLNARTRLSAEIAFARQVAMYVAHVRLGLKLGEIARAFDRDRTTVAHACMVIEDRRDDPRIDFLVGCIERCIDEWIEIAGFTRLQDIEGML